MLVQTSLIIGVLTAGALADRYSTDEAKKKLSSWLDQAKNLEWHSFVAQRSWQIYTRIFGSHGTSRRFILTSLALYLAIVGASLIFLLIFFPSTFYGATSVWAFGTKSDQFWWLACMAAGGLLYVLANAQTLYFLEILKTAPSLFKFLLVAYADLLITASISLFGLPALLTLYTAGISSTGTTTLALNVDFRRLTVSQSDEVIASLGAGGDREAAQGSSHEYTVRFSFQDSARDVAESNADYDIVRDAMARGQAPGVGLDRRGVITYASPTEFLGIIARGSPYQDTVSSFPSSNGAPLNRNAFCTRFALGALGRPGTYTTSPRMFDVAVALLRACRSGQLAQIQIPIKVNTSALDFGRIYRAYLFITLNELTHSITSSFNSYLMVSPYQLIQVEDPAVVWNTYARFFSGPSGEREYDQMVLKAYLRQAGSNRLVVNRGLAAGSINFSIMSTAAFNIVVMLTFFALFPVVKLLSKQDIIGNYITLEKTPFAVSAALVVAWCSAFGIILSLL